jgi:hypothetical protein
MKMILYGTGVLTIVVRYSLEIKYLFLVVGGGWSELNMSG